MTEPGRSPTDEAGRRGLVALVADDERNIRATLRMCLEGEGCAVEEAASASDVMAAAARRAFDVVFLDLRLGDDDGLGVLQQLLAAQPSASVVVITAYATPDSAVRALRLGAADYLAKPFTPAQVRLAVEQVRSHRRTLSRIAALEGALADGVPGADLATTSPAMRAAIDVVTRAAAYDAPVLLRGESGTGKGVLAKLLHVRSSRRDHPFVTVNCPLLTEPLLASELFGHARGAFTGADRDQQGRVEAAEGGTLFLDEIAEISPALQTKLLRFLQDRQFERVGETRTRTADVRVVAATNARLEDLVSAGQFREDLLFRLNVIEVEVPALRDRRDDIVPLARGFVAFFAKSLKRPGAALAPETENALTTWSWPGNVRELRNAAERAVILSPTTLIGPASLPVRVTAHDGARSTDAAATPGSSADAAVPAVGGRHTLDEIERAHILAVLASAPSLDAAAAVLGIDASTLWRKRKRYGV